MTPVLPFVVFLAAFADDPLPAGATARFGNTRMRVTGTVHGLQFASAGRVLVAADRDAVVGWDAPTGVRLFRHPYPPNDSILAGRVTAAFELVLLLRAKDGEKLAVVRMNLATGKTSAAVPLDQPTASLAAFRPDGAAVAVVHGTKLRAFDAATGKARWDHDLPTAPAHPPAYSADGTTLAVEAGKDARVFDAGTGTVKHTVAAVHDPAVSADGTGVAGAAGKKSVSLYRDGKLAHTLAATAALGFSPDGREVFATADAGVNVFDAHSGKLLRELDVPPGLAKHLSPDGTTLCGEARDAVLLFDAMTGNRLAHSANPPGLLTHLSVRRGWLSGVIPEWNGVAVWDLATGRAALGRPPSALGTLVGVWGTRVVYSKAEYVTVRDSGSGIPLLGFEHAGANEALLAVCPGTGAVAVAGNVGVARWDPRRKEKVVLPTTANDRAAPTAVAVAGDVTAVAYPPGLDGGRPTVELFRGDDHRHTVSLDGEARKLALSADGGVLAAECDLPAGNGAVNYAAAVIDTATGRVLFRTPTDPTRDAAVAVSACGRTLARSGIDPAKEGGGRNSYYVSVYEVRTGTVRRKIVTGAEPVGLAIDRRTLFTSQPGGPVLVWPVGEVSPTGTVEQAWGQLAAGPTAAAAQAWLNQHPAAAARLAAEHLKPVPPADPVKLAQWIKDLDAPQFAVRQTAAKELRKLGELAAPALLAAADETKSSEVREKVKALLDAVPKPDPETLRALRLIEVLEWQTTPAAAAELTRLAAGAAGAVVTRDAAAALTRMK